MGKSKFGLRVNSTRTVEWAGKKHPALSVIQFESILDFLQAARFLINVTSVIRLENNSEEAFHKALAESEARLLSLQRSSIIAEPESSNDIIAEVEPSVKPRLPTRLVDGSGLQLEEILALDVPSFVVNNGTPKTKLQQLAIAFKVEFQDLTYKDLLQKVRSTAQALSRVREEHAQKHDSEVADRLATPEPTPSKDVSDL